MMIQISKIVIKRYRSIMELTLEIDPTENIMSICGKNNVGKTNTLRAINLFFNPDDYNPQTDIPTLKQATYGGAVHPYITITFLDTEEDCNYTITRDFSKRSTDTNSLIKGVRKSQTRKLKKKILDTKEIEKFLAQIRFIYVESINLIVPELITDIAEDVINLEYKTTRFSKGKQDLLNAYREYVGGLQEILDEFADRISGTFHSFKDDWNVKFIVPKNDSRFRDLISSDVEFSIDDTGNIGVEDKGSGLQRLALLLLQFEIIERLKNNLTPIVFIDEPDLYLHEGLQIKLRDFLKEKSKRIQIGYTTHSKVLINTYTMKNVFLLDSERTSQFITRRNREINVVRTLKIDVSTEDGYSKICEHLGIVNTWEGILQDYNVLVEGDCDKQIITQLSNYFGFLVPNIISVDGAGNFKHQLNFYNSYYQGKPSNTPKVLVLIDNDSGGREAYNKISEINHDSIDVRYVFVPNFMGKLPDLPLTNKIKTNHEIEDFLYPEVICFLLNIIFTRRDLQPLDPVEISKKIKQRSFMDDGILKLCDYEKNSNNPEKGVIISLCDSSGGSLGIKKGIASLFEIQGNHELINLVSLCETRYPEVKIFLEKVANKSFHEIA